LLFEDIPQKTARLQPRDICLFGVLFESARSRKTLTSFDSRTRTIFRKLEAIKPNGILFQEFASLLEFVLYELKVPQRALPVNNLIHWSKEFTNIIKPNPKKYVGVGYKDQGSMSSSEMPELLMSEDQLALVEIDSLSDLWITFRDRFFPNSNGETIVAPAKTKAPEEFLGQERNNGSKGGYNAN
jgi:hypothetical protein